MRHRPASRALSFLAALAAAAVLFAACSGTSPSEPSATPAPPPAAPPGGGYTVTVTSSQAELAVGGADPAIITVQVRQSNGQPPPNGTTAVLATTLGALGSATGPRSANLTLNGGLASVALFPGTITGTAIVQAQISSSIGQTTVAIREPDAFFLAFVSPSVGSPAGGDVVTINGSGFEDPVRVTFGGVNAQVQSSSPTQIRVVTPASPGGATQTTSVVVAVTIRVNQPDEASDSLNGAFTYQPAAGPSTPQVFSVSPTGGPNEGGTQVTIVGSGFEAPVQVVFGSGSGSCLDGSDDFQGQEATIESVTSTRIIVRSPAAQGIGQNNLNQLVAILVRNLNTGLSCDRQSAFQYGIGGSAPFISGITPNEGSITGLDLQGNAILVTVFGQGFVSPVLVTIGTGASAIQQDVTSVTGSEIVFRLRPINAGTCAGFSGSVQVTNLNTNESATGPTFRYVVAEPIILGVNPTGGGTAGNTLVTISGQNFLAPLRVLFGGNAATVNSNTATSISARSPAFSGPFNTEPCAIPAPVMGDPDIPGTRQLPTSVAVQVTNLTTGCTDTLPGSFLYTPASTCVPN